MGAKTLGFYSVVMAVTYMLAAATPANAQNIYNKTAKSGSSQWIDAYYGWNADCSFRTINVDVVSGPRHGKVTPKVEIQRITSAQIGSMGACKGKKTKAVAVYYRSKRGYRGRDRFRVRMSLAGSRPVFYTYNINVR